MNVGVLRAEPAHDVRVRFLLLVTRVPGALCVGTVARTSSPRGRLGALGAPERLPEAEEHGPVRIDREQEVHALAREHGEPDWTCAFAERVLKPTRHDQHAEFAAGEVTAARDPAEDRDSPARYLVEERTCRDVGPRQFARDALYRAAHRRRGNRNQVVPCAAPAGRTPGKFVVPEVPPGAVRAPHEAGGVHLCRADRDEP